MNNKYIKKYSLLKVKRDKKNIYIMILLSLCTAVLLATLTFRNFYHELMNNYLKNDVAFRRVLISPDFNADDFQYMGPDYDYGYDKIFSVNHVINYYNMKYDFIVLKSNTFKNDKYDGTIELKYGSKNGLPKNIIGETITEDDTGVAVCTKNFYPSTNAPNREMKNAFVDMEKLIGSTFTINNDVYKRVDGNLIVDGTYEREFKIVGVFDSKESGEVPGSCYISGKDIKEVFEATQKELNPDTLYATVVTVDDYKNIGQVASQIRKLGFEVNVQAYIDDGDGQTINFVCIFVVLAVIISICLITMFYIKKKCLDNSYDIGMLKAFGYNSSEIKNFYFWQILIIALISFLIGAVLFLGILTFLKLYFYNYIVYNNYVIKNYFNIYVISLTILIIIPIVLDYVYINKLLKKHSIELIKGKNNDIKKFF